VEIHGTFPSALVPSKLDLSQDGEEWAQP